jgi:serine/threonine protein kinase
MSETQPTSRAGGEPPAQGAAEAALARYRTALITGQRPRIEDFLTGVPEGDRPALLRGLVTLDLAHRLRNGEHPSQGEYRARFPDQEGVIEAAFRQQGATKPPQPREASRGHDAARNTPRPAADAAGRGGLHTHQLGDYELLAVIARDELGIVYKARQVSLDRIVALKLILAGESVSEADLEKFYREARAAADLDHPGIIPIFEIGEHQGQHFVAMGFVEGQSLAEVSARALLAAREAAELTKLAAEAIAFAHDRGVVHRNLTPKSILLNARGRPKIIGFGLSSGLQMEGVPSTGSRVIGNPGYMAPEQAAGDAEEIGPATDVYALGAVLYYLLTGRAPFRGPNLAETLSKVLKQAPTTPRIVNPKVARELELICLKCLRKRPADRYATAASLAEDLGHWLQNEPIEAEPESALAQLVRQGRNHPATTIILASVLASGLLVAGVRSVLPSLRRANPAETVAGKSSGEPQAPKTWRDVRTDRRDPKVAVQEQGAPKAPTPAPGGSLVSQGKAATALVEVSGEGGPSFGSAFCIDPSGLFVTAAHVVAAAIPPRPGTVRLVLRAGEPDEKVLTAQVARASTNLDLAVLAVDVNKNSGLVPLALGQDAPLVEAMELTAFGYPLGPAVPHAPGRYPSISVNFGRITALRRGDAGLTGIQLDAALNPGNSGGPVLDRAGKVIGVVAAGISGSSGLNYAIPVDHLSRYLAAPEVLFDPPAIRAEDRSKPVVWAIDVRPPTTGRLPSDVTVGLKLDAGGQKREVAARSLGFGRFQAEVVPVPEGRVALSVVIGGQTYLGQVNDCPVKIGDRSYPMSTLRRLELTPRRRVVTATGQELQGPVEGLGVVDLERERGGGLAPLDLQAASLVEVRPSAVEKFEATVEVRQGTIVLASIRRDIALVVAPASGPAPGPAAGDPAGTTLNATGLDDVKLAGAIDSLAVGGDRYLLMVLKEPRTLVIFDAAGATIVKEIHLPNRVLVAAGASKFVLAYPLQGLFQRWDLATLMKEKDETTTLPSGARIMAVAQGSETAGPLLVMWYTDPPAKSNAGVIRTARASLIDLETLKAIKLTSVTGAITMRGPNAPRGVLKDVHVFAPGTFWMNFGIDEARIHVRAAARGDLFTIWGWTTGVSLMVWDSRSSKSVHWVPFSNPGFISYLAPGPDGRTVFTQDKTFRLTMSGSKPVESPEGPGNAGFRGQKLTVPTADPAYVLQTTSGQQSREASSSVTVLLPGRDVLLDVPLPGPNSLSFGYQPNSPKLDSDEHIHLFSKYQLLVVISGSDDRLILRRLPLQAAMERQSDHLVVISPTSFVASGTQAFSHQLRVLSRRGGVSYSLSKGPPNMSVTPDGKVDWPTTGKSVGREVTAVIQIRDLSGQDLFHAMNILVR